MPELSYVTLCFLVQGIRWSVVMVLHRVVKVMKVMHVIQSSVAKVMHINYALLLILLVCLKSQIIMTISFFYFYKQNFIAKQLMPNLLSGPTLIQLHNLFCCLQFAEAQKKVENYCILPLLEEFTLRHPEPETKFVIFIWALSWAVNCVTFWVTVLSFDDVDGEAGCSSMSLVCNRLLLIKKQLY